MALMDVTQVALRPVASTGACSTLNISKFCIFQRQSSLLGTSLFGKMSSAASALYHTPFITPGSRADPGNELSVLTA